MLLNFNDYRCRARRRLPRIVFDFIDGGADAQECMLHNTQDLSRVMLLPHCLHDVTSVDTTMTLFGQTWKSPVAVAPTGFNGLLRPGADVMLARAAAAAGVPFILSTASNVRLEQVASECSGVKWLQLYVMGSRQIAEGMMRRARQCGYTVLVLTVDVATGGNRERDTRNGMTTPFRPSLRTLLDFGRHPSWALRFVGEGTPKFANVVAPDDASQSPELTAALANRQLDRSVAWESLAWLRKHWEGPILIKGVLHPKDAKRALEAGVNGIIVSNHGGRQLDVVPSTISALPAVLDAVGGAIPVLVDGGFRRGGDVAKALALGAKAVLVGRPVLWGLAAAGEPGVRAVLDTFTTELHRAMTLLGAIRVDDLRDDHVAITRN
ncbi:MAG: alpha-hydroxy-acid oxidizing protein [Burkholderiaceae bacterium]|nr:MAG: alpha-hydroxy-acid oxidizing protein [Burkholderiaceae bacterium]TAM06348.1 MAG: alpha-hydroxy-acid oxidizing protein [Pusillimonas sp.]